MNKELEETIIFLKQMLNEYKRFGDLQDEKFEDTDRIYNQLEIALNYIENSIPKEKVEEKIKKDRKKLKELNDLQFDNYDEYISTETQTKIYYLEQTIKDYKELLEGK